jgi:hypothetical protein
MKWFLFIAALIASVLTVVLVPDHAHGMVWVGSGYLILSYYLIPRRPYLGWVSNFTGNALYLYPVALLHRLDLMVVPLVFTVLSFVNVCQELMKQPVSKN